MDRRNFKKVTSENGFSNAVMKAERYSAQGQNADRVQAKRAILQELGTDLSIRAERMRLKTRILSDGSTRHDNSVLEVGTEKRNDETYALFIDFFAKVNINNHNMAKLKSGSVFSSFNIHFWLGSEMTH